MESTNTLGDTFCECCRVAFTTADNFTSYCCPIILHHLAIKRKMFRNCQTVRGMIIWFVSVQLRLSTHNYPVVESSAGMCCQGPANPVIREHLFLSFSFFFILFLPSPPTESSCMVMPSETNAWKKIGAKSNFPNAGRHLLLLPVQPLFTVWLLRSLRVFLFLTQELNPSYLFLFLSSSSPVLSTLQRTLSFSDSILNDPVCRFICCGCIQQIHWLAKMDYNTTMAEPSECRSFHLSSFSFGKLLCWLF